LVQLAFVVAAGGRRLGPADEEARRRDRVRVGQPGREVDGRAKQQLGRRDAADGVPAGVGGVRREGAERDRAERQERSCQP
jgi:hypothetical protein